MLSPKFFQMQCLAVKIKQTDKQKTRQTRRKYMAEIKRKTL